MTRTTLDIDPVVLRRLKERQRREGKSLGRLVSELLAASLAEQAPTTPPFSWTTRPMHARVDLEDHDAVRRALGEP